MYTKKKNTERNTQTPLLKIQINNNTPEHAHVQLHTQENGNKEERGGENLCTIKEEQ